ncbi:MAG: hypothetical protein WCK70_12550, partial [Chloroflexales bacterium]
MIMECVSDKAAGAALDFPAEILAQLRQHGLVAGDGSLIDLDDAARVVAELRTAMAPFVGVPILISDAARKYGFNPGSIYNWVIGGWVKVLIEQPKRQVDEGDIALAKAIANLQGHIAGRAVFPAKPRSGRPRKER